MHCRICYNDRNLRECIAHEMMFGSREAFTYMLCTVCGCLQIADIPAEIGKYYPQEYYAKNPGNALGLFSTLLFHKDRYAFHGQGRLGRLLHALYGDLLADPALGSLRRLQLDRHTRILDVGCGAGALLRSLQRLGFECLDGVDPYNARDGDSGSSLRIRKSRLDKLTGEWDLIMLHHVFEHLPDPYATLTDIRQRLSARGTCLIRIPVVSSYAWEKYGTDWVQLDAPRHFYLHSLNSMRTLAQATGFDLVDVTFDSSAFQFWGSEMYRMGLSLREAPKVFRLFSPATLYSFAKTARELNAAGCGDQAVFYLQKAA